MRLTIVSASPHLVVSKPHESIVRVAHNVDHVYVSKPIERNPNSG